MQSRKLITPVFVCLLLLNTIDARRVRTRTKPVQREESEELPESESVEEDNRPQPALHYYNADSSENVPQQDRRLVLVSSDDDYNGYYGQPTARARADYNRPTAAPLIRSTTQAPRTKDQATKAPPVQTIRNYSKVNDDGSFTFGYEAADGSFKEETRGTDCVVRGKYGYIDPDGNKREFTYVSGNPCDPNNPEGQESDEDRGSSDEDSREPENVPQNYPQQRPVRPVRPIHTTTSAPTTVFQSSYSHPSLQVESEEEEPEPIQVLQPQRTRTSPPVQAVPQYRTPQEVTIRQRPRITVNTTPAPITPYQPGRPVSITPRPTYRAPIQTLSQTQPPPTTYRPSAKAPQQPAILSYSKSTSRPTTFAYSTPNTIHSTTRRPPIDFAAEFQKFQKEHNLPITTTTVRTTTPYKPYKPALAAVPEVPVTSNPIYESQLIYDPNSGQYDSALYQQLPQTEGDFQLNHKIQPYVHHPISSPAPQLVSLEQLAHVNPLYRRSQTQAPVPAQYSQQIYEKERENLQVLNSQQLFQQQQELQQQQLQQDRLEAARKATQQHQQQQHQQQQQQQQRHRFQPSPVAPQSQGFYYIQPSSGQIDAFIRGHNFDF